MPKELTRKQREALVDVLRDLAEEADGEKEEPEDYRTLQDWKTIARQLAKLSLLVVGRKQ